MKKSYAVTIGDEVRAYPAGTAFRDIAQDFQDRYPSDILLV